MYMAWLFLILGGILEVGWAIGLSLSNGFTNLPVLVPTLVLTISNFYLFSRSLKYRPISTAYAVFTGLGSFGTAVVGMIFLGDQVSFIKIVLGMILISCIIGLKFISNETTEEKRGAH